MSVQITSVVETEARTWQGFVWYVDEQMVFTFEYETLSSSWQFMRAMTPNGQPIPLPACFEPDATMYDHLNEALVFTALT